MHLLTTRVEFSSANRLRNPRLSEDENRDLFGPCARTHGHNYVLEVTLGSPELDPRTGMVYDLYDVWKILREEIVEKVDHRDMAEVEMFEGVITTTEGIVQKFYEILAARLPAGLLQEVRLYESPSSWAAYRPTRDR